MYLNTLDVKLNLRDGSKPKLIELNENTLAILMLIFEFKIATTPHISRFISGVDESKYLYKKLRKIWQSECLESFKIYSGGNISPSVYYMLSKKGLNLLVEKNLISKPQAKNYPKAKTLLDWGLFKHEAQIVELASLETKNNRDGLKIDFLGEVNSQSFDFKDDKNIEALSPDYTVFYQHGGIKQTVFTEFERTKKSHKAMESKIDKYLSFFEGKDFNQKTLRIIFQNQGMEKSFWLNTILNQTQALKLNIVTSYVDLIKDSESFLKEIYANESGADLIKETRLDLQITKRIKLFNFL